MKYDINYKGAEEFILDEYGSNWLNCLWNPSDVIEVMVEFAKIERGELGKDDD